MKKFKRSVFIILLATVLLGLSVSSAAWYYAPDNSVETHISQATVIQQYFHCGTGTQSDPFVITRPIHYYHLVELYQRNSGFEMSDYYFQLGYDFNNDGHYYVYDYNEYGSTTGALTDTLHMTYYSGDFSLIPIGTSQHPFGGHFDGKGLTIADLSVISWEQIGSKVYGTCDLGVFGYVKSTATICNIYFTNLNLSVSGASATSYTGSSDTSAIHDQNNDSVKDTVCVGYIIGHLLNYTNAADRDYENNLVGSNSSPISNVYVNKATVTCGTSSEGVSNTAVSNYGFIGYVDTVDNQYSVSIRTVVEASTPQGSGDESWGGSINMTSLFGRVTELIGRARDSGTHSYPSAETIVGASTSNGYPKTSATSKSGSTSSSIYYWSALSDVWSSVPTAYVNTTGGAIFGSRSGDWTYLYGQRSGSQYETSTVTNTKTGDVVTAYNIYDNGAYMAFDGTSFSGAQIPKLSAKWIPVSQSVEGSNISAKYYMLIDEKEYYLAANGTTGVKAVESAAQASVWVRNDANEFYTVIGSNNYYLNYNGTWALSESNERYAIGDGNGHYLSGSIGEVHNESNEDDGAIWKVTSTTGNSSFYFTVSGTNYYLTYNGTLTVRALGSGESAPVWKREESGGNVLYYYEINSLRYYLLYDNGWKAVIKDGYKLCVDSTDGVDNLHFLKVSLDGEGNTVIGDTTESDATVFQITSSGGNYSIVANINGIGYVIGSDGTEPVTSKSGSNNVWKRDGSGRFYQSQTFADVTSNYYLLYQNEWKLAPLTGYKLTDNDTHFLSLGDTEIVNQNTAYATIWQLKQNGDTYAIYTVSGKTVYYLNFNNYGLCVTTVPIYWNRTGNQFYYTLDGDNLFICYQNGWLLKPQTAEYIHEKVAAPATPAHYLTYRNTGVIDGVQSEACTWVVKQSGSTYSIYTYIGTVKYYLGYSGSLIAISKVATTWYKDANGFYVKDADGVPYYLTFDSGDNTWKLIVLTNSIKFRYTETGSSALNHYLHTVGSDIPADVENEATASMWINQGTDLYTYVGTSKYYLTYKLETVLTKSSDGETVTVTDAHQKIVPFVSTAKNANGKWYTDSSGYYYLDIKGIRFYLYYDTESHEWALEEYGGYQIKCGDSYLTLRSKYLDLAADSVAFVCDALVQSSTGLYQWHFENGQLYTLVGDSLFYLTYTQSSQSAAKITATTVCPSSALFSKNQNELYINLGSISYHISDLAPAGYNRLEYIESTGNQIINTGVTDGPAITVDCDVDFPLNKGQYLFGSTQASSMMYNGLYSTNVVLLENNYLEYRPGLTTPRVKMTQSISDQGRYVNINGVETTLSVGAIQNAGTIYIFGCNNGARYFGAGMKLYSFAIRSNNVLIRNFIPVERESDGAIGLYDTVYGVFYGNSGSGNFTCNEITKAQYATITGSGYTVLDSIKSTGNQIIDTGIKDDLTVSVDCDVELAAKRSNYLFGSQQNSSSMMYNGFYCGSTIDLEVNYNTVKFNSLSRQKMTQRITGSKRYITVNGTEKSVSVGSTAPQGNLYVFGCKRNNGNVRPYGSGMILYRFTVRSNGTKVRDFIPVMQNSTGKVGLYDLIEGTFYVSSEGTNFEAGPIAAENGSSLYMVPDTQYSSISSSYTYMTVSEDSSMTIGAAAKDTDYFYQYHQFTVTTTSSGTAICVKRGTTTYYLSTNGSGSTVSEKGTLSFVSTPTYWNVESGGRYYRSVGGTNYYLIYTSAKGWFASPKIQTVNFYSISSGGKYLIVNDQLNGISYKTNYATSDEAIRWFVDSGKLYSTRNDVNYYLTWSASAGFGVTQQSASATVFNVGGNSISVTDDYGITLYFTFDYSGWNLAADSASLIYSGSTYINISGNTLVADTNQQTKWIQTDNKIYSYYNGKRYFWSTDGSNVTLNESSGLNWTSNSASKYSCTYNSKKYYVKIAGSAVQVTTSTQFRYYITYSGTNYYLGYNSSSTSCTFSKRTSETTNSSGGTLWTRDDSGYLYVQIGSTKYYLTVSSSSATNETSMSIQANSPRTWTYNASSQTLTTVLAGKTGYLIIKNNSSRDFRVAVEGGTVYKSNIGSKVVTEVAIEPSDATALSTGSLATLKIPPVSDTYETGMEPQVLVREGCTESAYAFAGCNTTVPASVPTVVPFAAQTPNIAETSVTLSGQGEVLANTVTRTTELHEYHVTPSSISLIANIKNPTVSFLVTSDRLYVLSAATGYKRGTYLPLAVDEDYATDSGDYRASYRNTGHIVGGAYSAASGSGQGDIRVSRYSISNISRSYSNNMFSNIYTFNDSGTTPVLIDPNANSFSDFAGTKQDFLAILQQDNSEVYGLHFMDTQISTSHVMYAESVMLMNRTYINYELPESCIDFNASEQGHIILYAGDYYTSGNSCFFSLHQIFRDSEQHITAIKEISEIYTKPGLTGREYYVYKFTDNTYSNANGTYTGATTLASGYTTTPIFKTKWLTNPTNGRDFSNDYIYYFEIPCNKGEYALGSVSGQDGGYLLYLDIAANGVHGTTYNQTANISNDPLFTQIGYLSKSDDPAVKSTWINSLLNISYTIPANNGNSNFSITVEYDPTVTIYDAKYNTTCQVFDIIITNTTGFPMDLYVLLVDDDDDVENDYNYRYRVKYNGAYYTISDAFDTEIQAFYATASLNLSVQ